MSEITKRPFIPRREVITCTPNAGYWTEMPKSLKQPVSISRWSPKTIHNYVAMLKAFGFNAIQIPDAPQVWVNEDSDSLTWRKQELEFCRAARSLGMGVSLYVWGTTVLWQRGQNHLCPHDPFDRKVLDDSYAASTEMAPLVDQFVSHWVDPGGANKDCPKCNIDSAQELHNELVERFRAVNPDIQSYFSTWFITDETWPGYEGVETLLRGGLPDDVGICIGLMNWGADGEGLDFTAEVKSSDLEMITSTGRKAGIWSWYTTDIEILPSLHVHANLLQNYFRSLPAETRDLLSWHSVEDNNHGLNMPNLYVAGHLMQDPSFDGQALLKEFAEDYFGPASEPALLGLRAVEMARTRSRRYAQAVADPSDELHAKKEGRRVLTAAWRQECMSAVQSAQAALEKAEVPSAHKPSFPAFWTPQTYLNELKAHLVAISEMLRFLEVEEQFWALSRDGADAAKLRQAHAAMPEVHASDRHYVQLERHVYQRRMENIKAAIEAAGK